MTDGAQAIFRLQAEIAMLQQAITALAALPEAQRPLQAQLAEKEQRLAALLGAGPSAATGPIITESIHAERDINIATSQTITYLSTVIYGPDPDAAQREQVERYLRRLAARMQRLPLHGLAAQLDDGPGVALPQVYVMLATTSRVELASDAADSTTPVEYFYQQGDRDQPLKQEYDPDHALPDRAVVAAEPLVLWGRREHETSGSVLYRALLAAEAVARYPRLVLLGEPGGGKSTFLRHLAWALARRGLGEQDAALFGWQDASVLLPVLLPLRTLALRIAAEGAAPATVSAVLRDELAREYDARQADGLLDKALASGAALLLLDGLDELPIEPARGIADRLATLRAVREFAELHAGAHVVLTCRSRAFDARLRAALGWPVETLAPFTLGQVRRFVADWYVALAGRAAITRDQAAAQAQTLVDTIVVSDRLQQLAGTPLLLTMMALVLAERGELPRDRPLLYERILEQLLGQWDRHKGGQSLAAAIGAANLRSDDLRAILDQLCYDAFASATAEQASGLLAAKDLRYALASFFAQVRVEDAWEAAGRCLAYFDERSGLLLPADDGQSYAFAHLTLQEYGAGRHMLLQPNAAELVLLRRADERWREPIALGLGVVQRFYPMLADRIERVLSELIDPDERGRPKLRARWYRDLILAAELGQERDWNLLRALINVDRLQRELRRGLVALLADPAQPLPVAERVYAGFLLGDLGDPRFPVTLEEWRDAIIAARAGQIDGYFCLIPSVAGTALWIARYPITNAQLREWTRAAQLPPRHHEGGAHFNRPNQPAAGVSWHLASAFCAWLSQQAGATIRLPNEAEWEAAARGHDERRYPWGNQRLRDRAATKEDHELRGWPYPVPVGCYPAGASAIGALDMAGNVWEWTSDLWRPDGEAAHPRSDGLARALRGGGYLSKKSQTLVTARIGLPPGAGFDNGFRVLLEIGDRSPRD
jgi:Sulfatase-modifying factor enzyme 1/NACHT domain